MVHKSRMLGRDRDVTGKLITELSVFTKPIFLHTKKIPISAPYNFLGTIWNGSYLNNLSLLNSGNKELK
jgi:hypothetical protein